MQPGDGKLTVVYETGTEVGDDEAQRFLEKRKVLEDAAGYANSIVGLAYDVPVKGTSCDGAAFWSNDSKDITVCYAFVAELRDIFGRQQTASPDVDKQTVGMINGALFHELGHALVAMYRLPVTGREEDAVDQLSVLLMAAGDERHHDYAIDSINAWGAMADAEQGVPKPFDGYADEHSLNAQRFFNWTCWLYGSDPEAYASLVQSEKNPDGVLPEERAERCPSEFQQLDESWSTLLQPYLKASST